MAISLRQAYPWQRALTPRFGGKIHLVTAGSSLSQQGNVASAPLAASKVIGNDVRGIPYWMNVLSHQAFEHKIWIDNYDPYYDVSSATPEKSTSRGWAGDNCAISGCFTWQMINQKMVERALMRRPDIALIQNNTNEMANTTVSADVMFNLSRRMYEPFLERGIPIIIGPEPIRGSTGGWDDVALKKRNKLKDLKMRYADDNLGVMFVDLDKYIGSLTDVNGYPVSTTMLRDDIHYWHFSYWGAKAILERLDDYITTPAQPFPLVANLKDVYSADHPTGVINLNPFFNGTAGNVVAPNVTTSAGVADSYRVIYDTATTPLSSIVASKVATRPDGRAGSAQKLTVTTTGAAKDDLFYLRYTSENITAGDLKVGDFVEFSARMKFGKWAGWGSPFLRLDERSAGVINYAYAGKDFDFGAGDVNGTLGRKPSWVNEEVYGTWLTEPLMLIGSDVSTAGLRARLFGNIINDVSSASGDPTVTIEEWAIRKVPDPRIPKEGR
jgi:hypothetical protein